MKFFFFELLRKLVRRDYAAFSGHALEEYFRQKFAESGRWTRIGKVEIGQSDLHGTFTRRHVTFARPRHPPRARNPYGARDRLVPCG